MKTKHVIKGAQYWLCKEGYNCPNAHKERVLDISISQNSWKSQQIDFVNPKFPSMKCIFQWVLLELYTVDACEYHGSYIHQTKSDFAMSWTNRY